MKHFIKCYVEWKNRFAEADEINDLSNKILSKFNYCFLAGSKLKTDNIDIKDYDMIKTFLRNMIRDIKHSTHSEEASILATLENKLTVFRILTCVLEGLAPKNVEPQLRPAARNRLRTL